MAHHCLAPRVFIVKSGLACLELVIIAKVVDVADRIIPAIKNSVSVTVVPAIWHILPIKESHGSPVISGETLIAPLLVQIYAILSIR